VPLNNEIRKLRASNTDAIYSSALPGTALAAASNPIFVCVPSQNGFDVDAPHRQSATIGLPSGSGISDPSALLSSNGPDTRYGPFAAILIDMSDIYVSFRAVVSYVRRVRAQNAQSISFPPRTDNTPRSGATAGQINWFISLSRQQPYRFDVTILANICRPLATRIGVSDKMFTVAL